MVKHNLLDINVTSENRGGVGGEGMKFRHSIGLFPNENNRDSFFS